MAGLNTLTDDMSAPRSTDQVVYRSAANNKALKEA